MAFTFDAVSPRTASLAGLLALIPTLWFGLRHPGLAGYVSAFNVVLIAASLFLAMSPLEGSHHDASEEHTA